MPELDRVRRCRCAIGVVCALLLLAAGCGRKAPPRPPKAEPLPVATNVSVTREGDAVRLSWTLAPLEGRVAKAASFALYRDDLPLGAGACPSCPPRYRLVARPVYDPNAPVTEKGQAFQYTETVAAGQVAAGYRYRYQVALRLADGRQGEPSNAVEVTFD